MLLSAEMSVNNKSKVLLKLLSRQPDITLMRNPGFVASVEDIVYMYVYSRSFSVSPLIEYTREYTPTK